MAEQDQQTGRRGYRGATLVWMIGIPLFLVAFVAIMSSSGEDSPQVSGNLPDGVSEGLSACIDSRGYGYRAAGDEKSLLMFCHEVIRSVEMGGDQPLQVPVEARKFTYRLRATMLACVETRGFGYWAGADGRTLTEFCQSTTMRIAQDELKAMQAAN